jgi:hypothetical protein
MRGKVTKRVLRSSTRSHQPSAISHQPSAISHQLKRRQIELRESNGEQIGLLREPD